MWILEEKEMKTIKNGKKTKPVQFDIVYELNKN